MLKKPKYYRMFNYNKNLLPNQFIADLERDVNNLEDSIEKTGHSVGYPGWNLLYYAVLCSLRDNVSNIIIETGTNVGCSTIMLAQALKDSGYIGHIHTIEIHKEYYVKATENIKKAGLIDIVTIHHNDSIRFLSDFSPPNGLITFAFLDGCHDESHVIKEFELLYPYLDSKSIVFFDNTYLIEDDPQNRRVHGAISHIKMKYCGNLVNFENTSWYTPGQAMWQKGNWF